MSEKGKSRGPGSRILRERAMNVLRETRAKIDPLLLAALKDRISSVMPAAAGGTADYTPRVERETVFKAQPLAEEKPVPRPEGLPDNMEPVDKQKIAQIVLHYMKNREEKSKH